MVRIKYRYLLFNILYPGSRIQSAAAPEYLTFQAPTPEHITQQLLVRHIRSHIAELFGDHGLGVAASSLKLIYFSNATSTVILRVPRSHHRCTWAALTMMTHLPASQNPHVPAAACVVRVVRVSGTIRKAEEELIRRSRRDIVRAQMLADPKSDRVLARIVSQGQKPTRARLTSTDVDVDMDDTLNDTSDED